MSTFNVHAQHCFSMGLSTKHNHTVDAIRILIMPYVVSELSRDVWSNIWISKRDILEGELPREMVRHALL